MNLIMDAFTWLGSPSSWSGTGAIPQRIVEHLLLSGVVVLIAFALAVPLGILVGHFKIGGNAVSAIAGAGRAIPTLGLLTLLGLWLGIGLSAPILALIVLAAPPLLAGAFAGVSTVEATTVTAARAIGMSQWQVIRCVEIPLAAPLILGGLRSAVTQVIATATLAAYTADAGLGRYIFTGLKTRDYGEMIGGALLVIALALLMEATFALITTRKAHR